MTDRGILELDERADLSRFVVSANGYSGVKRGDKLLFPRQTEAGQLYFSRAAPAAPLLVDWKPDTAA